MDVVLLPVRADLYALPVEWVQQVVAAPSVTRLVTAPSPVIGLFNLRGEIIPLLDTAALLGIGRLTSPAFAVVLHSSLGPVALAATELPGNLSLDGPAAASDLPGTAGTYQAGELLLVLLDPSTLLAAGRFRETAPATASV
jgi:purine-binding chemotaxis protein CheW